MSEIELDEDDLIGEQVFGRMPPSPPREKTVSLASLQEMVSRAKDQFADSSNVIGCLAPEIKDILSSWRPRRAALDAWASQEENAAKKAQENLSRILKSLESAGVDLLGEDTELPSSFEDLGPDMSFQRVLRFSSCLSDMMTAVQGAQSIGKSFKEAYTQALQEIGSLDASDKGALAAARSLAVQVVQQSDKRAQIASRISELVTEIRGNEADIHALSSVAEAGTELFRPSVEPAIEALQEKTESAIATAQDIRDSGSHSPNGAFEGAGDAELRRADWNVLMENLTLGGSWYTAPAHPILGRPADMAEVNQNLMTLCEALRDMDMPVRHLHDALQTHVESLQNLAHNVLRYQDFETNLPEVLSAVSHLFPSADEPEPSM